MLHTAFFLAHEAGACPSSYKRMAKALGGVQKYGRDTPIPLTLVLDTLDIVDALWCLRVVLPEERALRDTISRLFVSDYAEHVLPIFEEAYPNDLRPRRCLEVARRYDLGQASRWEVMDASEAVLLAAGAAAEAASWAASAAAEAAAYAASWAVSAVAETAAYAAYGAASWAARAAALAAGAAYGAAWDAESEWQAALFRERMEE